MNTPTKLNNPGDLKNPSTGQFRHFANPQQGFQALKDDLAFKMSGKAKSLGPESTLAQFSEVYAPTSDNAPKGLAGGVQYAEKLAKQLGVSVDTTIGSLKGRLDDFAKAIAVNEGYAFGGIPTAQAAERSSGVLPFSALQAKYGSKSHANVLPFSALQAKYGKEQNNAGQNPVLPFLKQAGSAALDVGIGAGKQVARTLQNIGDVIAKPLGNAMGIPSEKIGIPDKYLQDTNTAQKVGDIGANLAEFVAPAGEIAKGEEAINAASKALPYALGVGARIAGKAGLEAAQGGLTAYAQTGDPKDAIIGALTFGGLKGATGTIGETAKAFNIPEHLYSTIFSRTADDFKAQWEGVSTAKMQKNAPDQLKQLMDAGIVHDEKGKIAVDASVARKALDKGLSGSGDKIGTILTTQMRKSEMQAQQLANDYGGTIKISYPSNMVAVLRKTAKDFKDVADNKYSNLANELADKIEQSSGQFKTKAAEISGKDALTLRRFLDAMRTESSFEKSITDIRATSPRNYKFLSDKVRTELNAIPGMKTTMKDYAFQIRALDDISNYMTKEGHKALISMWDTMIFDVGLSGGLPGIGGALAIGRRTLASSVGAKTGLAQTIERGAESKLGAATKGSLTNLFSAMSGSSPQQ